MLVRDDVEFVSLDIGHLVGPDNVLSRLEAEGAQVHEEVKPVVATFSTAVRSVGIE